MAPEVEPIRNATTAGTIETSSIWSMFVLANAFPKISEAPEATVTFLRSIAPKAAKVTSQTALFFRVFLNTSKFVLVITRIAITPMKVAIAMSIPSAAFKTTVAMMGKNESISSLMLAFLFTSVLLSVFCGFVFLSPIK